MKLICSYCRADLGFKEPIHDDRVSHSMCEACFDYFERQWDGQLLGDYLDQFEVPVLVVTPEYRVVAANQRMADALGRSDRELFGLLGGEAVECVHARLPEGCGGTVHCKTCTIRLNVAATTESREPRHRIPASLTQSDGEVCFYVSTEWNDGVVIVILEEVQAS